MSNYEIISSEDVSNSEVLDLIEKKSETGE